MTTLHEVKFWICSSPSVFDQMLACLLQLLLAGRLDRSTFANQASYRDRSRARSTSNFYGGHRKDVLNFPAEEAVSLSKESPRTRNVAIRFRRAVVRPEEIAALIIRCVRVLRWSLSSVHSSIEGEGNSRDEGR